jgi:1-deoxy-D-xylulose-5-phosphate reductoisomerase
MDGPTTVAVAGSSGSIGRQTLEVVASQPEHYRVSALATGANVEVLVEQAIACRPDLVALADESGVAELRQRLAAASATESLPPIEIVSGSDAVAAVVESADVTVNGVVGFAGLPVTLACLLAGRRLALANKESLIAAGPVVQRARSTAGAELVPVDSEHAALHQCLRSVGRDRVVANLQLTASGGPFREWSAAQLAEVTVEQALEHPTWSMGPKITVDSSTLMNKGLEVIEANELFGVPAGGHGFGLDIDQIEVVVHPQSIVHSMATFADGSTIAQLSEPDMRLPIAYALAYPDRFPVPFGRIDWSTLGRLDFEPPDRDRFPCLDLAFAAGRAGGTAPARLSAGNEVVVEAFLDGRIRWVDIAGILGGVMDGWDGSPAENLDAVLEADRSARRDAARAVAEAADRPDLSIQTNLT